MHTQAALALALSSSCPASPGPFHVSHFGSTQMFREMFVRRQCRPRPVATASFLRPHAGKDGQTHRMRKYSTNLPARVDI